MPRPSILVVDDNSDFCGVAASILRAEGFDVDECVNAQIAISRLRTTEYSAVVVEPSPSAGLVPLLSYLASQPAALTHVVAATTEDDPDFLTRLRATGIFKILHKPVSRDELRQAVDACCSFA
jgi:CheY-like chemotaxis protein